MDSNGEISLPSKPVDAYAAVRGPMHRVSRGLAHYVATKRVKARNNRPLVSITFDDVPDTALINGARVLEHHSVRGTFYIAGGLCGAIEPDRRLISASGCVELHRRGHEIGCHTFTHPIVQALDSKTFHAELEQNRAFFASLVPELTLENFCYPYGLTSFSRKLDAQARFHSCRSSKPGINTGNIDLGFLKAIPLDQAANMAGIIALLEQTVRANGWLILFTHDVAPVPTWIGCTPKLLDEVITEVLQRGCEIVTIREGLRRIGSQAPSASHD